MAFEFSRNVQDLAVTPAAFALPSAASSSTNSTAVDLGASSYYRDGGIEFELSCPALSATIVPDTRTVTYIIETSASADFSAIDQVLLSQVSTGAGGAGVGTFLERVRPPSNCARYVRAKVTFGASTTTGAAVSASFKPLF